MPMYDFFCSDCQKTFEELSSPNVNPPCPHCGGEKVERNISAPSPLKTGAFPYKVGPVHPIANKMAKAGGGCAGGGCPSGGFS